MQNYMPQGMEFNPDVLKKMKEIDDKLEEMKKEGNHDADKINQMRMEKLLRGMQMNTGYMNNYRAMFPY